MHVCLLKLNDHAEATPSLPHLRGVAGGLRASKLRLPPESFPVATLKVHFLSNQWPSVPHPFYKIK